MARKVSKNQSKATSKTANKKNKTQVQNVEPEIEDLSVDSAIINELKQPAAAKPARRSAKKANIVEQGETKEHLMKRVKHELLKTFITAAVSMTAGILLAEFITLH